MNEIGNFVASDGQFLQARLQMHVHHINILLSTQNDNTLL